jgi:hypothetical protein
MGAHLFLLVGTITTADMPPVLASDFSLGRYALMIERVDSLLAGKVGLTIPELARLHLWKGFGQAAGGDRPAARASFGVALSLDVTLELDPRDVSPKILAEFESARTARLAPPTGKPEPTYLVVEDSRPAAALRSMILPGWGQWSLGRRTRGAAFAAVGCAALGSWLAAAAWEDDAHDRYLHALGADIPSAYDEYNRAYKIHRALGYTAIAVWAGAVSDVLLGPTTSVRVVGSGTSFGVVAGRTIP